MDPINERLIRARQTKGSTIEETAAACGITVTSVKAYEAGQRIPRDSVKNTLAEYYGVYMPDLFF